jgi:hypothetical protein
MKERRGEERGEERKSSQRLVSFFLVSVISLCYKCAWLVGWLGAVNRARGVCIRLCEDRSDVLFDLSAADHRRLYQSRKVRGTNQMLI